MEFSSSSSQMIMQGFEQPNGDLFNFYPANPNPNPDLWHVDGFSIQSNQGLSLSLNNPMTSSHQEHAFMDDGRLLYLSSSQQQLSPFMLRRSKYLIPAIELLNEFCNVGGISNNTEVMKKKKTKEQWEEGGPSSSSSSLCSLDLAELQKRKAKLLLMLEEVYRRYKRYSEQMRAVVSSFESIAGEGSATVYSTLASKAMSRHFRCLKDGITSQIQATKMAMGERDTAVTPGATKGETPRLKKLEQCLRQQKAFQNAGILESQPWRPQRGLPERSVSVLRAWLFEHFLHPYPSDVDKHILSRQTGLSRSQVSNWFINARVRLWKPMVEEMYTEELKEEEKSNPSSNPNSNAEDQKPVHGLLMNESDSPSSIINNSNNHSNPNPNSNPNPDFGVVDLDFSSYNASGVSLTLGFSRDHIDDERQVQFSILDEDGQNLAYRNLMDAHLLHDLTG